MIGWLLRKFGLEQKLRRKLIQLAQEIDEHKHRALHRKRMLAQLERERKTKK